MPLATGQLGGNVGQRFASKPVVQPAGYSDEQRIQHVLCGRAANVLPGSLLEGIREKSAKKIITDILLCFVPILLAAPVLGVVQSSFNQAIPTHVIRILM